MTFSATRNATHRGAVALDDLAFQGCGLRCKTPAEGPQLGGSGVAEPLTCSLPVQKVLSPAPSHPLPRSLARAMGYPSPTQRPRHTAPRGITTAGTRPAWSPTSCVTARTTVGTVRMRTRPHAMSQGSQRAWEGAAPWLGPSGGGWVLSRDRA